MHLALYQPAIPTNTGNIGRLCVGMDTMLHIIGPCAFDFDEPARRRAGLDYWQHLRWRLYPDPAAFLNWLEGRRLWAITKFGRHRFDRPDYNEDDVILLGNEKTGIPDDWHDRWEETTVYIPIIGPIRSYNQANAAAMVLAQARCRCGACDAVGPVVKTIDGGIEPSLQH